MSERESRWFAVPRLAPAGETCLDSSCLCLSDRVDDALDYRRACAVLWWPWCDVAAITEQGCLDDVRLAPWRLLLAFSQPEHLHRCPGGLTGLTDQVPDDPTAFDLFTAIAADLGHGDLVDVADHACTASRACLLYTSPSPRDRTRSRMP